MREASHQQRARRFLFILDGFDEFGSKENLCEKLFNLEQNPHIKVIVTSRTYYVSTSDIVNYFSYNRTVVADENQRGQKI